MNDREFRERIYKFDLTIAEFAWLTGLDKRTCKGWGRATRSGRGTQLFPRWVPLLLDAWELGDGPPRQHPWDDVTVNDVMIRLRDEQDRLKAIAYIKKL